MHEISTWTGFDDFLCVIIVTAGSDIPQRPIRAEVLVVIGKTI